MPRPDLLLVALNARYIHTNPAVRSLAAYCRDAARVEYIEYPADQPADEALAAIVRRRPQAVGFSCYLWNIRPALDLAYAARQLMPDCAIMLGGPEVSWNSADVMAAHPYIDCIVRGEGEETLRQWLLLRGRGGDTRALAGTTARDGDAVIENPDRPPPDMDALPFCYSDEELRCERIVYYESSRGCPFSCAYCLSAATNGVRFRSIDRVFADLARFARSGTRQVKLVDRTFNCDPGRARSIFAFLMSLRERCGNIRPVNFHFELCGDLLDDETLLLLRDAPPGLFQFEIGVQSTHSPALRAVNRRSGFDALARPVARLISTVPAAVHLDLIAGLPGEDIDALSRSFDDVYRLGPHRLQLGFLKLLHGAPLRRRAEALQIRYAAHPPYEVLSTPDLPYEALMVLKDIEKLVELYYNSHIADSLLRYIVSLAASPFALYRDMAAWWRERGLFDCAHGIDAKFKHLEAFGRLLPGADTARLRSLARYDRLLLGLPGRQERSSEPPCWRERTRAFFRDPDLVARYLPHLADRTPQQRGRVCLIEAFSPPIDGGYPCDTQILLFDYSKPGRARAQTVAQADLPGLPDNDKGGRNET
jgi:radical SAM superfamily enzyme YgiQ (UPF0313 family)